MTATPPCSPPRQQIIGLHRRLEHLFLQTLLPPFQSVESQTAEFSDPRKHLDHHQVSHV